MTITEQLREAVEHCGMTRYAIAQRTGIPESVLCRFVTGGKGLRTDSIDPLCQFLGLELRPIKPTRKTTRKAR
jgi:DNA-binding Xre family transcriptional regulator